MRQKPSKDLVPLEGQPVEPPPKAPATTTAVAAPLPGARRVDAALLDAVVADVNRITTTSGLEHARAVAEVVVGRLGGGDLDAFQAAASEHATWRALASRTDLAVSHSFLWSCVAVLEQLRELPPEIGMALPVSHHKRLLTVKDDDVKLALATRAVEEGMTVQELEAAVAATRPDGAKGEGRKPLPPFAKAIRGLPRLFEGVKASDVTPRAIAKLGADEVEDLVAILDSQLATLHALRDALAAGLDGRAS